MDFCYCTPLPDSYNMHQKSSLITLQAPLSQKPKVLYLPKKINTIIIVTIQLENITFPFSDPSFIFLFISTFSSSIITLSLISHFLSSLSLSFYLSAAECSGCQLRADLCPQAMPQPLPASYLEPACIMHHGCVVPLCAGKQGCRAGNSSLLIGSGGRLRQSIENRRHTSTQMRTLTHNVMLGGQLLHQCKLPLETTSSPVLALRDPKVIFIFCNILMEQFCCKLFMY